MAVANGTVLECVVNGLFTLITPCVNVIRLQLVSGGPITEAQCVVDLKTWTDLLYGDLDDILTTSYRILSPVINEVSPNPRYLGTTTTTARTGIGSGDCLPIGACMRIKMTADNPRIRGSHWFTGVRKDYVTSGVVNASGLPQLQGLGQWLVNASTINGRVYRRGSWSVAHGVFTPWTGFTADSHISYLLRRVPRT